MALLVMYVVQLLVGGESVAVVDGEGVEDALPVVDAAGHVLSVRSAGGRDEVEDGGF
jgi:hypothetical protein